VTGLELEEIPQARRIDEVFGERLVESRDIGILAVP
jgi:hypothetical protein